MSNFLNSARIFFIIEVNIKAFVKFLVNTYAWGVFKLFLRHSCVCNLSLYNLYVKLLCLLCRKCGVVGLYLRSFFLTDAYFLFEIYSFVLITVQCRMDCSRIFVTGCVTKARLANLKLNPFVWLRNPLL